MIVFQSVNCMEQYRIQMQNKKQDSQKLPKLNTKPIRDLTNTYSLPKLATRLYKNASLTRLNPNISMLASSHIDLDSSTLNKSNSNSNLIASISLKKLRKSSDNFRHMEISNGKILISDHSMNNNRDPKLKKMFKKLDKINTSNSKILPDDLIDFPIEKDETFEPLKKVNKSVLKQKSTHNSQNDKEELLPQDFIQLLQEENNITNQFCYLQKMDHPYDLKIIEFDKNLEKKSENEDVIVYPNQYITISSRGITYFGKQQSRFVPLEEWRKQASYFSKIIKLDFFKNYKKIKSFGNWKKYIRKSSMKSTIDQLKQKLVFNDRYLRQSILETRRLCWIMENDVSYCKLDECKNIMSFKEFKDSQQAYIRQEFQKKMNELEQDIKSALINNMSDSMRQFKQQNKISSSVEGKGMPLLIGDEKNLEMPYTKQATLRTQQQKFQKFIKLVDMVIIHSKVNMMNQSTNLFARKLDQQNQSYERQVIDSKYKNVFKGKQYLQCNMVLDINKGGLSVLPAEEQLESLFQDIVNRSVVRLCRNHKKMSSDLDILSIIYDSQDQIPKQNDSDILKSIMTSDDRQEKMMSTIMKPLNISYLHIVKYATKYSQLAKVNFENVDHMKKIDQFSSNDHDVLSSLLEKWKKERQNIMQIPVDHEGPLFILNLKDFKEQILKSTESCILKAKQIIPKIFKKSVQQFNDSLVEALSHVQQQPLGIQSFIQFQKNKNTISDNIKYYQDQMTEINGLYILLRSIANPDSSIPKNSQKQLKQALDKLTKKINEANINNKLYEKRALDEINEMIPRNKNMLNELYKKIEETAQYRKTTKQMLNFIEKKAKQFQEIKIQSENIKLYKRELQRQLEGSQQDSGSTQHQIINFSEFFILYHKIWQTKAQFEDYCNQLYETCWGKIKTQDVQAKFEEVITCMMDLSKEGRYAKENDYTYQLSSSDFQAIKQVIQSIEALKPLVQVIFYLNDETLGEKEMKEIKLMLEDKSDLIKIIQKDKKQTKTRVLKQSTITNQLQIFKTVVSKAKKNNDIQQKLAIVKEFGKPHTVAYKTFRNLSQNFRANIQELMDDLDEKIILINSIHEELDQNQKYKTKTDRTQLYKLREILLLWDDYQKHNQYFEPIYNYTEWRTTKEGKNYNNITSTWNKNSKQLKESQNPLKITGNDKILQNLKESNEQLEQLYSSVDVHFQAKRAQCFRLYFLSNSEIMKIYYQNKEKEFRQLNPFLSHLFPSVKQINLKTPKQDEPPSYELQNLDGQKIALKFGRTSNFEIEQIIRSLQEAMKGGVKENLKNCQNMFDKDENFVRLTWIQKYCHQSLLFISSMNFTRIMQQDYLCENRHDLQKFYQYTLSTIQELKSYLEEDRNNCTIKKVQTLLILHMHFRDVIKIIQETECVSLHDYNWIKQVRTYNQYQVYNEYLTASVAYGNQFVCPSAIPLNNVFLNEKMLIKIVNQIVSCDTVPIVNSSLLEELSIFNARPYRNFNICTGKESVCLQNFINGTWLIGSFSDITLSDQANLEQFHLMAQTLSLIHTAINNKEHYHLKGCKNLSIHRDSGISLVAKSTLSPVLCDKIRFQYRCYSVPEISWDIFISLVLEVKDIKDQGMSKRLGKILSFIEITIGRKLISRDNVQKRILQIDLIPGVQDFKIENKIAKSMLNHILAQKLCEAEKNHVTKIFNEYYPKIYAIEKFQSQKSFKEIKESFDGHFEKITRQIKESQIVIICGKGSLMKEMLVEEIISKFSVTASKERTLFVKISDLNKQSFLGKYEHKKWMPGIISEFFTKNTAFSCLVLTGQCSSNIFSILSKLGDKSLSSGFLLENGDRLILQKGQKIILITEDGLESIPQSQYLKVVNADKLPFDAQQTFQYLAQRPGTKDKKNLKQKFFAQNQQAFNGFKNIYINNMDKISNSNLKMIGYKNQFIDQQAIMERFIKTVTAVFDHDIDNICINSQKMLQKVFFWSLYWSISSSLPKSNLQRLDKIFDTIKINFDRSQVICETKLAISQRNQSISKAIKINKYVDAKSGYIKITSQMEAKAEFLKMMSVQNCPIFITGGRDAGKSVFLDYLTKFFNEDSYVCLKIKIHKDLELEELLKKLEEYTFMKYFDSQSQYNCRIAPKSGKKLILMLDDLNLVQRNSPLLEFIETCSSQRYFLHQKTNKKVQLGDIWFICAENSSYEYFSQYFIKKNFIPLYINPIEPVQVIQLYQQKQVPSIQNAQVRQTVTNILSSIGSLHTFAKGLENSDKNQKGRFASDFIPFWIARELIYKCRQEVVTSQMEIIGLWKFLTVLKYCKSGIFIKYAHELINQLNNLIGLLVKNAQDMCELAVDWQSITNLVQQFPCLELSPQYRDYFKNLWFLLNSNQQGHILSNAITIPYKEKARVLRKFSELNGFKFVYIETLIQFRANPEQKAIIYIDGSDQTVVKSALIYLSETSSSTNNRFIIDYTKNQQFEEFLKKYPSVLKEINIISKESLLQKNSHNLSSPYYEKIQNLMESIDQGQCFVEQSGNIWKQWEIHTKIKQIQLNVKTILNKRVEKITAGRNNFISLCGQIDGMSTESIQLQYLIKKLQTDEQKVLKEKNGLVNSLVKVKANENITAEDEKQIQLLEKKKKQVDEEIKKVQSIKNDKLELFGKLKDSFKEKEETFGFMKNWHQQYFKEYSICAGVLSIKEKQLIITTALLVLFYEAKGQGRMKESTLYKNMFDQAIKELGIEAKQVYSSLLDCCIQDVEKDQIILRWSLSNYEAIVCAQNENTLLEMIQQKAPKVKLCITEYEIQQNVGLKPIFVKDHSLFGKKKVSILKPLSLFAGCGQIKYELSKQDKIKYLKQQVSKILNISKTSQKGYLKKDIIKMEAEYFAIKDRMRDKIESQNGFSTKNQLSQLKQLYDTNIAFESRVLQAKTKIDGCTDQINNEFGEIIEHVCQKYRYLLEIQELYSYVYLNKENYLQIFRQSLTYDEPPADEDASEQEEGKQNKKEEKQKAEYVKKLLTKETNRVLDRNIIKWVTYSLIPQHAIEAYFLYACFQEHKKNKISSYTLQMVLKSLKNPQMYLTKEITGIENILSSMFTGDNPHTKMLQYGEQILMMNFRNQVLMGRDNWVNQIPALLDQNVSFKEFVVIGHEEVPSIKLLEEGLRQELGSDNNILFYEQKQSVNSTIEHIEKSLSNQSSFIVLIDWKNVQNMSSVLNFLKSYPNRKLVFFFSNRSILQSNMSFIRDNNFYQIALNDKNQNICTQVRNIMNSYSPKLDNVDALKTIKMVAFEEIGKILKNIIENKACRPQTSSYRIFQNLLKKSPKITLNNLISFFMEFMDKQKNRVFIREAKKISKWNQLPQIFDDAGNQEIYTYLLQTSQKLIEMMENEVTIIDLLKNMLPQAYRKQIKSDTLFCFSSNESKLNKQKDIKRKITLSLQDMKKSANMIIKKVPIPSKRQEKVTKNGANNLMTLKLLSEKKVQHEIKYGLILEKLKSFKKIIDSGRYISKESKQTVEKLFQNGSEQIQKQLWDLHESINNIKGILESKENNKLMNTVILVDDPKQYAYAYIFENQPNNRKEQIGLDVQIRCITEKEREICKESIEKAEYIMLENVVIENAKMENHKCVIEMSAGETCKLTNLYLVLSKQQRNLGVPKIPIYLNNKQLGQMSIMYRLKEPGFWEQKICARVLV